MNVPVTPVPAQPEISAFSISGSLATIVVSNVEADFWYTVWSGSEPGVISEFVQCKKSESNSDIEFSFTISSDGNAGFYAVTAGTDEKSAQDTAP